MLRPNSFIVFVEDTAIPKVRILRILKYLLKLEKDEHIETLCNKYLV